ncbi:MAG: TIGR01777 family oxidoreductase [Bacteroidales bacterium]|nr:TIGR01777 family oxidoreductase [Bacteroidales bacterium]
MKQVVLITGANGMVANYLAKQLEGNYSVRFLTQKVSQDNQYLWDLNTKYIDVEALKGVNHIIHLAGTPISGKRWSRKRKQAILHSRVDSAQLILETLKKHSLTVDSFISASAIGYYGTVTSQNIFTEESSKGNDFLSDVCGKWEDVAHLFKLNGVANRVSVVRMGIVLDKNYGAFKRIVQPIKLRIGASLGTGNQYMPWIHIHDLCGVYKFIIDNNISGTFNGVAPEHVTNTQLTKSVGRFLNRRIILPNIPEFLIKFLFGKMSVILLKGSRVSSDKILQEGYCFNYQTLDQALSNLLK